MDEMIRAVSLTKRYGDLLAVDQVDFSVRKGEIFGFLGLNGAGKTTTIRMLLGMISPTSGECCLKGKKVTSGRSDLWKDVGYIVETPHAYPELTVRENLEIVCRLRGIRDSSRIDRIIGKLKLERYEKRKARHLSTGNAQRLGIAKAMVHDPAVLMLDEPSNGLDPAGIVEIREVLQDLAGNHGVAVLVSSHQLDEVARIATDIAIIHKGRLIRRIDGAQLEDQLQKKLMVDGKDRGGMAKFLREAGYRVDEESGANVEAEGCLQLKGREVVENPERIAALLVNAGYPPSLIMVEKEDLETYFLRTIREEGGGA
jgi:ABC-2 type transport system ATP-binding protein